MPNYLKCEVIQVLHKVQTVLVQFLLPGTSILVSFANIVWYFKTFLYLEQVIVLPSAFMTKTKDASVTPTLFCLREIYYFEEQKLDVKQLKLNKFINYVYQLIISTSNATFQVPLLRLWAYDVHLVPKIIIINKIKVLKTLNVDKMFWSTFIKYQLLPTLKEFPLMKLQNFGYIKFCHQEHIIFQKNEMKKPK